MKYRPLLKNAWIITKKNKFLWYFGFFTLLIAGPGGDFELLIKNWNNITERKGYLYSLQASIREQKLAEWAGGIREYFHVEGMLGWGLIALVVVLFVFLIWVASTSQSSLIYSVFTLKKKAESIHMNGALLEGKKHSWVVMALNIFQKGICFILLALAALPLVSAAGADFSERTLLAYSSITFLIIIPFNIILSLITKYATSYAVVKRLHFWSSLKEAWKLFKNNWVISIETAILIFLIYTFAGGVLFFIAGIATVPFILLSIVSLVGSAGFIFFIIMGIYTILFLALIILFASILTTYEFTVWTLVFAELIQGKKESALHQTLHPILSGSNGSKSIKKRKK